ncbi:MAG: D-glycero-beta-D-manno-heptose 1-phosphate adenylyltransferase, partial [Candidatus Marinimicrobia bacterium]|nr:D-glycero-beta-D-manno-heptose 1-phosphate adenylyltransferase [Candidatus Neomarinimicrobiota bacterium]
FLNDIEVDTKYLYEEHNRITSKKTRIIASQQQVVRYDLESKDQINIDSENAVLESYKRIVSEYDVILLSDYGKGVLTNQLTQSLIGVAKKYNKKVLVDPKGSEYLKYKDAFLLTPNKKEASLATKIDITDEDSLADAIIKLKSICALEISLITLSDEGIAIFDHELRIYPTVAKEVFDVTGAGDTVLACLGFALASGFEINQAVEFANLAGGVVVGKIGSATATLHEIIEYESSLKKSSSETHIKKKDEIASLCNDLKLKGKKIVFTNGCFDLLHSGHVSYLEAAKKFGDILVIGVNSDQSVKSLKGKDRPINEESERAYILAALEVVDYVVIFEEETPYELIKLIQPNTLVKGGDYKGKEIVGEDIADELKLVEFIKGKSSTKTIKRIKQSN